MMRRTLGAIAAAITFVVIAGITAQAFTYSQKVLVYCPPTDTAGCETIISALGNADRGYDGTNGTVDLRSDLSSYAVLVIPSLADDGDVAPYALLRDADVAAHLRQSVLGRRAFWSGTPDQGSTNRDAKNALLVRLAQWAGANHVDVGSPGLVVLQDGSVSNRYNWVAGLTGINVIADPALATYNAVRAVTTAGTAIVADAAYTNMAARGFYLPTGAAGISLDAVGQTGTSVGGQIVLMTHPGVAESEAVIATDKDDYAPGETVVVTGSGFLAGESVLLTLLEDPEVHEARTFNITADSSGTFTFDEFAPESHDMGVRFILTARGATSGRTAETTFTDSHVLEMVIMPANVSASSGADYVLVINLRSNITVGWVRVTHPSEWSGLSLTAGSTVASAGKSWSASYNSGSRQITLVAAATGDRLTATGQAVAVRFTANTSSSTGVKAWQAQGWSNLTATGTSHAIPDQKLNIGSNDRAATAAITPISVAAGTSNVHTVTITRTVGGDPLGSIGLTVPSGFTITAMSAVTAPGSKAWTGAFDVGTGFVRLLASADASRLTSNGQAISFTLTLTAPAGAATHNLRASAWKGFHFDDDPFDISTQPSITTTAAGPTKLDITTSAHTGTVNQCLGIITVQTQDAGSVATNVTSNTDVSLATNGTGTFYSDNACTNPIAQVTINAGSNSANFYYKATARGTGTHQVTVSASGLTQDQQNQTINKANQATLTVTAPASGTYSDKLAMTATGGSGTGAVTFEVVAGSTACAILIAPDPDAGKLHITSGTGTCTIKATKAADDNYNLTTSADHPVTVNKANQATLTVTAPNSGNFGDKLTMSTSGGSGTGAVTFEVVAGSTACSILMPPDPDAGALHITSGTGTCAIKATKAPDANYNSATSADHPVTISKANQATLTVTAPNSGTYGEFYTMTATGGSGTGALSFEVVAGSTACAIVVGGSNDGKLEVTSGTGTCSIKATKAADDSYNSTTSADHPVTVNKANQATLTVAAPNSGNFGDKLTMSTSGGSGTGAVTFEVVAGSTACSILMPPDPDAGALHITSGTGTCTIKATKAADANYNSATSADHPVTINKANQAALTVTAPTSGTYGDKLTMTTTGGSGTGAVTFEVVVGSTACVILIPPDPDAGKLHITSGTGTCSIKATKAADANYNSAASADHSLTISKANQATLTVTAPNAGTYGQFYTMTATGGSGTGALSFAVVAGSTACSIVVGGINDGKLEITSGTGTCAIKATKAADANYNSATSADHPVTVNKADQATLTVTAPTSGTFGDKLTPAATGGSGSGSVSFNASGTACAMGAGGDAGKLLITAGTGTCSLTATKAADANYNQMISDPASVTVSKAATSLLYGGTQIIIKPNNITLKGTLSSAVLACKSSKQLTFQLQPEAGSPVTYGPYSTDANGVVNITNIASGGLTEGVYGVMVEFAGDGNCAGSEDEASLTVAEPGQAATGGGWYTLNGSGRVNFGFTVRLVKGTGGNTGVPAQYRGQLLLINNSKWRCKGTLDSFGLVNSTTGVAGGMCDLQWWDFTANGGLGEWVAAQQQVVVALRFTPGNGGKGKNLQVATFGADIQYTPVNPQPSALPNSAPTALKGGDIQMK
jgi:hypothetical protein